MIDAKALLGQFLGSGSPSYGPKEGYGSKPGYGSQPSGLAGVVGLAREALGRATGPGGLASGSGGGFAGGAAAGGLAGLLLGGKMKGKGLAGLLSHGGAAALGALAHRAYAEWQRTNAPAGSPAAVPVPEARFLPNAAPATDGLPFELALVRAMIGAAKADGHMDAGEQNRIFAHVEQIDLPADAKAWVFDSLAASIDASEVAAAARTPEQAAELYLVSRLAISPDQPAERAYLQALAHHLALPPGLAHRLDEQAAITERDTVS